MGRRERCEEKLSRGEESDEVHTGKRQVRECTGSVIRDERKRCNSEEVLGEEGG